MKQEQNNFDPFTQIPWKKTARKTDLSGKREELGFVSLDLPFIIALFLIAAIAGVGLYLGGVIH